MYDLHSFLFGILTSNISLTVVKIIYEEPGAYRKVR